MPCLVLNRRNDPFAPLPWARELADTIPGAELVVTEGTDHLPWFGDHRPLVDAIAKFVGARQIAVEFTRRLATIMFTDIVDSTVKAVELGDARWSRLLQEHNRLMREELDAYGGDEVKTTGDGFLAVFGSSARAVECARAVMQRIGELGLTLRAGIHTGEIEVLDDDVAGLAVHLAARIAALARPGEILLSKAVKDLSAGSSIGFTDRGVHELKGIPDSWQVYAVAELQPDVVIDLRQPRQLQTTDHISLFLARRAPAALRALAAVAAPSV
jgi:class 3 adenylate cyclase